MWSLGAIELWRDNVQTDVTSERQQRKRPLAEMDANAITPRKVRRRVVKGEPAVLEDYDDGEEGQGEREVGEEEPTPRQHPLSARPLISPTSIRRRPTTSLPSRTTESSPSASIESTESRKRKRSTSPSKQRLELNQYAEYALRQRAWGRVDELPEEMRVLAASMQLIAKGRRVLSDVYAHWRQEVGSGIVEEDELIFAKRGVREEIGDVPDLSSVRRILQRAQHNAQCYCSEAAWNSGVHDFLLDLAHRNSRYADGIAWENITTARIYPSNLLGPQTAQDSSTHERAESKRVDFCIALNMDPSLGRQLKSKNVLQLNHTDYGGTRYNPISVSIETKAGVEAGPDATLQLTTWVAAQNMFLRRSLQKLGNANVTIPSLPLIMIQGHQWNFYYAQITADSTTLWYGGDAFGNTSTLLGIYRIIAGLQQLMQWSETVYKPWLIENVIGPMLES